ncbi:hypothetical protein SH467x_002330 [Pirellulaceae bacterium SH467]
MFLTVMGALCLVFAVTFAQDSDSTALYATVANRFGWFPTINVEKAEGSAPELRGYQEWDEFKKLTLAVSKECELHQAKFSKELKSARSNQEKEVVVRSYVLESQERGRKYFHMVDELLDPSQRLKIVQTGMRESAHWVFDPWVNDAIGVDASGLDSIRKLSDERLSELLSKISDGFGLKLTNQEINISESLEQLQTVTKYLKLLNRQQQGFALSIVLSVPHDANNKAIERTLRSRLVARWKETDERARIEKAVSELISVLADDKE